MIIVDLLYIQFFFTKITEVKVKEVLESDINYLIWITKKIQENKYYPENLDIFINGYKSQLEHMMKFYVGEKKCILKRTSTVSKMCIQ